jgi:hypothetical protein
VAAARQDVACAPVAIMHRRITGISRCAGQGGEAAPAEKREDANHFLCTADCGIGPRAFGDQRPYRSDLEARRCVESTGCDRYDRPEGDAEPVQPPRRMSWERGASNSVPAPCDAVGSQVRFRTSPMHNAFDIEGQFLRRRPVWRRRGRLVTFDHVSYVRVVRVHHMIGHILVLDTPLRPAGWRRQPIWPMSRRHPATWSSNERATPWVRELTRRQRRTPSRCEFQPAPCGGAHEQG